MFVYYSIILVKYTLSEYIYNFNYINTYSQINKFPCDWTRYIREYVFVHNWMN